MPPQDTTRRRAPNGTYTHGTSGYRHGCRCAICADAQRIQSRLQYERRTPHLQRRARNGTYTHGMSGYDYGCRCPTCAAAKRADGRAYYIRNRARIQQATGRYQREHPESGRQAKARYQRAHPDLYRRATAEYNARYPERVAAVRARRRARQAAAPGYASAVQIRDRLALWGNRCHLCGIPTQAIDHVIPLARGGTNWPANLRPCCRTCNIRKGARPWRTFVRAARRL